jgi:hypothetical protein
MYTLKLVARRSTALGMALSLLAAVIMPAAAVYADALNPLTERSLLLSSSAPGYQDTDGSGNPTYAPAGSGPNGKKTGETFTFTVSSTATVHGMSFQYCTTAAGLCRGPGNNNGDARGTWDPVEEEWNGPSTRETNEGPGNAHENSRSDLDVKAAFTQAGFGDGAEIDPVGGEFQIYVDGDPIDVDDWEMNIRNAEDDEWENIAGQMGLTGKNNYITLSSATGLALSADDEVKVVFKASESVYITNPGADEFFVKINTYDTADEDTEYTDSTPLAENEHVIDGGVTVANVMTDSIHIVTKVLETMSFSVGIENPDTVDRPGSVEHGRCEPISQDSVRTGLTNNRLNLGNPNAEYSLETGKAWDVYSYWRLSSNSSGGATVYYSGNTLANTSGDEIADMQSEQLSNPGTEQFGLGFVDAGLDTFANSLSSDDPAYIDGNDSFQVGWEVRSFPFITVAGQSGNAPYDSLAAQAASSGYDEASGRINDEGPGNPIQAKFQFHKSSLLVPEVIAQQNEMVISCATAKMRYVANIGADTPAGVYTTKINYLAAPQY